MAFQGYVDYYMQAAGYVQLLANINMITMSTVASLNGGFKPDPKAY